MDVSFLGHRGTRYVSHENIKATLQALFLFLIKQKNTTDACLPASCLLPLACMLLFPSDCQLTEQQSGPFLLPFLPYQWGEGLLVVVVASGLLFSTS